MKISNEFSIYAVGFWRGSKTEYETMIENNKIDENVLYFVESFDELNIKFYKMYLGIYPIQNYKEDVKK